MMNIIQQLKVIVTGNDRITEEELSPLFLEYKGFFRKEGIFEGYVKGAENIFNKTSSENASVLDVGCGFGLMSILMAILGAKEVTAVDTNPEVINIFKMLLARLNPPLENIRAEIKDAVTLDFDNETFDVVIASDVVSHMYNLDKFFRNMKRMLKNGGRFYLYDSNNSLDIRGHILRRCYWKKVECGPCNSALLPPKPFIEMRREIIKKTFPTLDEKNLEFLSKKTRGMSQDEIVKAVDEFVKTGKITQKRGFRYVDPRNGSIAELEFNPFRLKRILENHGFQVKIIPPFTCFPYPCSHRIKDFIKRGIRVCFPLSLFFSPSFEILAKL